MSNTIYITLSIDQETSDLLNQIKKEEYIDKSKLIRKLVKEYAEKKKRTTNE